MPLVALWGGSAVRRYAPDGTLERVVELPVPQVTSCTFRGERLDELYVTSACAGLTDAELAEQPLAGGLFRVGRRRERPAGGTLRRVKDPLFRANSASPHPVAR